MLMIDDPEIERLVRDEAARTGEAPVEVLRRVLGARPAPASPGETPGTEQQLLGAPSVRNGIQLFPVRPGAGVVTHRLVKQLLGASE